MFGFSFTLDFDLECFVKNQKEKKIGSSKLVEIVRKK